MSNYFLGGVIYIYIYNTTKMENVSKSLRNTLKRIVLSYDVLNIDVL